jgi:hypothetical protein
VTAKVTNGRYILKQFFFRLIISLDSIDRKHQPHDFLQTERRASIFFPQKERILLFHLCHTIQTISDIYCLSRWTMKDITASLHSLIYLVITILSDHIKAKMP